MRRVSQHFQTLDGIRFERTVKYQESIKDQSALDVVPVQVLDLSMLEYISQHRSFGIWSRKPTHLARICFHDLVTQCQDTRPSPGKVLVRFVIVGGQFAKHALERLGRPLDAPQ